MAVDAALDRTLFKPGFVDRWIHVFMAGLLTATTVVGFAPKSAAIVAGVLPTPPPIIHIHAALMVAWLGLLLTQAVLRATGRGAIHMQLGLASLVLGPCVVGGMIGATLWRFQSLTAAGLGGPAANLLLAQGRAIVYFTLFFVWALLSRKTDPETHKRMIFLATFAVIPAAITRMTWLPTTMPESIDGPHAYMLLLLAPALAHDVVRLGRPHTAYLIGLALLLPWLIATHFLWGSPWWLQTAPKLMSVLH